MKSLKPNLAVSELITEPDKYESDLSEAITQTLSRLMGYDNVNQLFRLIKSDVSGRLLVTSGFPVSVSVSTVLITTNGTFNDQLKENNKRLRFIVQNRGSATLNVTYANLASSNGSLELVPGETLIDDDYKGSVSLFTAVFVGHVYVTEFVER